MNSTAISTELDRMATQPGIVGCAIVDASTGMIWLASAGGRASDRIWEAAVDYWRLHNRQKLQFSELGVLHAAVMYHASGVLAVFPCCTEPELLLVAHGLHRGVDWHAWQARVRSLGQMIGALQ